MELIDFIPMDLLSGKRSIPLEAMDVVTFYGKWAGPIKVRGEVTHDELVPYYEGIKLLDVLYAVESTQSPAVLRAELTNRAGGFGLVRSVDLKDMLIGGDEQGNLSLAPGEKIVTRSIQRLETGKTVTLLGQVDRPGVYDVAKDMRLSDLLGQAGGVLVDRFFLTLTYHSDT